MCVCVCAFSLHRESPDMILGDNPLISEVVLSQTPPDVIVERFKPSVKSEESTSQAELELMIIDEPVQQPTDDWMSLIRAYLNNQSSSDDNTEVKHIAHKSRMYHLIDGVLFQQSANGMMMKCIYREEGIELWKDVHKGVCGSHSS
jgi:hypothetical protein